MNVIRMLGTLLAVALLMYGGLLALMYVNQRELMYFPQFTRDPPTAPDFHLEVDGARLAGWVVQPGQPKALLVFGGNAEDLSFSREDVMHWAPEHTVFLVAYRGFGHSTGEPSETALVADAIALFDHVAKQHRSVDVFGRSLGTGVAVQLAAVRPVRRLALVTPFDSMLRVAQAHYPWLPLSWLLKDRFESWQKAPQLTMPTLFVIGGQDSIVPPERGEALAAAMPRPPKILRIPDAQHNDIHAFPELSAELRRFFSSE